MTSVGVLVTNYNSWDLALACIQAHQSLHGGALSRTLLLDDCSSAPPPAKLPMGFELVRNERNIGFAASLNKGVRLLETDIVLIFDADARPLKPYLDVVRQAFCNDHGLALLGFSTVDSKGAATASWHSEPNLTSLLLGQKLSSLYHPRFKKGVRICIPMAAMAVRRKAFDEVGGFDESLDWLDVDFELSMKINRSAWKLRVAPDLLAFHEGGGTPMKTADKVLRFYKSRWALLRKFGMIKRPQTVKILILLRLQLEYLAVRAMGKLLFKESTVRRDKIVGRRRVIQYCRANYR